MSSLSPGSSASFDGGDSQSSNRRPNILIQCGRVEALEAFALS